MMGMIELRMGGVKGEGLAGRNKVKNCGMIVVVLVKLGIS